jgi:hypothetical protein
MSSASEKSFGGACDSVSPKLLPFGGFPSSAHQSRSLPPALYPEFHLPPSD